MGSLLLLMLTFVQVRVETGILKKIMAYLYHFGIL